MVHLCFLSFVFLMLSRLFIAALWLLAGKGLTSWLLLVMFIVFFFTFPFGILGQVWYLSVPFPDLYRLSYFGSITKELWSSIYFTPRFGSFTQAFGVHHFFTAALAAVLISF